MLRTFNPPPSPVFPVKKNGKPALLAHRGSAQCAGVGVPENSRAAFDACIASGEAQGLETDVHATADGYPVISHDPRWHAVDADVEISQLTWEELCCHRLPNGEKPMGFEEFLDRYPGIYLNIDLKVAAVVAPVLQILKNRSDLGRLGVGSFSARRVWQAAQFLGDEPGYLPGVTDVARFLLACESGMVFSWKNEKNRETSNRMEGWGIIPRLMREYNCALAIPERMGVPVLTPRLVAGAHQLGCPVYVWTVNDVEQYKRLTYLGVDAIYTDNVHTFHQLNVQ